MRVFLLSLFFPVFALGQPNCNVFLWDKDTLQYKACVFAEEHRSDYYQFDWRQMEIWEEAISICPYFAFPYRELAAPYVKSGNFIQWKKYIDKAVEYAPSDYLEVRASLRYKFFADYKGALEDIAALEKLREGYDIGFTSNGTYHLQFVKGLCLKALGKKEEAIEVMEKQLNAEDYFPSLYDYLHLGFLYLEKGAFDKALVCFLKQAKENDLADNRYYLALAYRGLNNISEYKKNLSKSLEMFEKGVKMSDPYNELFDQIYLQDIREEMGRE
ncbi:MAG: hypothetical protein AAF242_09255 [Bacteroidota bacterium]